MLRTLIKLAARRKKLYKYPKCHLQTPNLFAHLLSSTIFSSSMEESNTEELGLLFRPSSNSFQTESPNSPLNSIPSEHPSLDLNLSISIGSLRSSSNEGTKGHTKSLKILKQQTVEQIRLAAVEKAYAERVRELTRRELELAEKEFARARLVWERAKEEVEKVERMKEMAATRISSTCLEITCQSCRQRFWP